MVARYTGLGFAVSTHATTTAVLMWLNCMIATVPVRGGRRCSGMHSISGQWPADEFNSCGLRRIGRGVFHDLAIWSSAYLRNGSSARSRSSRK